MTSLWTHSPLLPAAAEADQAQQDGLVTSLWTHSPLLAAAALGDEVTDFGHIVGSFWEHSPLLTAAANSAEGFRNRHRDLPRYIDGLDEDEEEAIFGLLAGRVFG